MNTKKVLFILFLLASSFVFSQEQELNELLEGKWFYTVNDHLCIIEFNSVSYTCIISRWNDSVDKYNYSFVTIDDTKNIYIDDFMYLISVKREFIELIPRFENGQTIILRRM